MLRCNKILLAAVLASCGEDSRAEFELEVADQEEAVLALAALDEGRSHVLAVGGPLFGDGAPFLMERDRGAWSPLVPPSSWRGAIWSASRVADDVVWIAGARMQLARGRLHALEMIEAPPIAGAEDLTLFGVWGASADDVWIAGGEPSSPNGPRGLLLHWNGASFTVFERDRALYKVWGANANDVVIVGDRTVLHWDGASLTEMPSVDTPLITVDGAQSGEIFAVGGFANGVVLAGDRTRWKTIGEDGVPPLEGLSVDARDRVFVAGDGGYLAMRDGAAWRTIETALGGLDIHGLLATPGGVLAAGGRLTIGSGSRRGFVGRWNLD